MVALLLLLILSATGIERATDPALTAIAAQRAIEVQTNWSHDGKPPEVAEVLAYNSGYLDPVTVAMQQWQDSPAHWSVLSDWTFTRIGCATALAGDGVTTFVVCELAWPEAVKAVEPLARVPRVTEIPTRPVLLPDTDLGASSATTGVVRPLPIPPLNVLLLGGSALLGALALWLVLYTRRMVGIPNKE